jgi:acyl-CoA synthetase (AMP-forming)/AMP-acid ligase II
MDALTAEHNIARQLTRMAQARPEAIAIAAPRHRKPQGQAAYDTITFRQLDEDSTRLAAGLQAWGVRPAQRIVLLVRPGIDFISLTFALFKAAAVVVLIDPGMGRGHLLRCLEDVRPDGFVAIPLAQLARCLHGRRFPRARVNVTVGRRWGWGGTTLNRLRRDSHPPFSAPPVRPHDPAAIIFTTGSTGPPKGVLYEHENFASQVAQLQEFYQIQAGEVDLPGFPLFALFNSAMGVTTVIPDMDPRHPAEVDPARLVRAMNDWQVNQAFGSPAIWNVVGQYCQHHGIFIPSLRRVLSAGAPVPPHILSRMKQAMPPDGDVHTPYGATESLPVASIAASEVLGSTAAQSAQGAGTCVGRRFSAIRWRVIRIDDQPIDHLRDVIELAPGEIGELIVQGPAVTRAYVTQTDVNALVKIRDDNEGFWHRMGDVGYLDDEDRFWFCGRKAHRVQTAEGPMYTVPCEAIYNQHPAIYRSALVGIGPPGEQTPVMICEPWRDRFPQAPASRTELLDALHELGQANRLTQRIERSHLLLHRSLPVDIRHNAKIFREQLAPWAARQLEVKTTRGNAPSC